MAAAAGRPRCLSDLPDELLQRILFFVPGKEAASTAVLSRRWRSLWRASGAVHLDSRHFINKKEEPEHKRKRARRDPPLLNNNNNNGLLHRVDEALAGATAAIRKLTLVVKEHRGADDLVVAAISSPAARHLEELHVDAADEYYWNRRPLSFVSMSSHVLRALRVSGSSSMAAPPPGTFPRLTELHLKKCNVSLADFQDTIDAAPQLATLRIESSCLSYIDKEEDEDFRNPRKVRPRHCLICPGISALVFEDCRFHRDNLRLQLDSPGLKYFRYNGAIQICNQFLLKTESLTNIIAQVDLHLNNDHHHKVHLRSMFWKFIKNFSTAKFLKLKMDGFSMDQVFRSKPSTLLFNSLERLELDAQYKPTSEASMSALASLLHCCPVVRDLRLKVSKDMMSMIHTRSSIDQEARADFDKSVDRFRRRRCGSPMRYSLGGEDEDDDSYEEGSSHIIRVLREQSFRCLESCLRRVSLHFCMDKPNCLGVQLAKFFAQKGRVLEELYIDDGSHKLLEHINACVSGKMDC